MNIFKYTPIYSLIRYGLIVTKRTLKFENINIGKELSVIDSSKHKVFKEIYLVTPLNKKKEGAGIFQVIFHAPKEKLSSVIKRTNYTIPFFIGLPGFCNKQFLVNKNALTFAGNYEWETVEMAKKYAHSYAVAFMARRSSPYKLKYRIIDKTSGKVIEEREL